MLTTATTRKNLALLGLTALFVTVFILLGNWQMGRAGVNAPPLPTEELQLTDVLAPHQKLTGDAGTHPIVAVGRYRQTPQVRVVDQVDGKDWVVAAFTITLPNGQEATLPVARGMISKGAPLPATPAGSWRLTGRLQASHAPNRITSSDALDGVSVADLRNRWPGKMYAGYLALRTATSEPVVSSSSVGTQPLQTPESSQKVEPRDEAKSSQTAKSGRSSDPVLSDPVPLAEAPRVMAWHNISYSLQWYCFALFAIYMWVRVVMTEHQQRTLERRQHAIEAINKSASTSSNAGSEPATPA